MAASPPVTKRIFLQMSLWTYIVIKCSTLRLEPHRTTYRALKKVKEKFWSACKDAGDDKARVDGKTFPRLLLKSQLRSNWYGILETVKEKKRYSSNFNQGQTFEWGEFKTCCSVPFKTDTYLKSLSNILSWSWKRLKVKKRKKRTNVSELLDFLFFYVIGPFKTFNIAKSSSLS